MQILNNTVRLGLVALSGLVLALGCGNTSSDSSGDGGGSLLLADDPIVNNPGSTTGSMNQTDSQANAVDPANVAVASNMGNADTGSGTPTDATDGMDENQTPMASDTPQGSNNEMPDTLGTGGAGMANPLPGDCTKTGFQGAREIARRTQDGYAYVALTSEMSPYDALQVATLGSFNGPMAPGVYSLDGINYADCGLCLLIEMGCGNPQEPCSKTFYADAGSVEITAVGNDRFAGKLTNVVFREVNIDDSFTSTPVEGGEKWCFGQYSFDVAIDSGAAGGGAPAGGGMDGPTGDVANPARCADETLACIGEQIQDFSLINCGTGMPQSMNEYFEGMKGGWYVLTAGWCPACTQFIPSVLDVLENPAITNKIKTAFVLGEDGRSNPATIEYCRRYGTQKNIPLENLFMDNDGTNSYATLFRHVWPYIGPDGSFGLPFNALFEADTMTYIYADRASPTDDINAALNRLLR